MGINKYWSGLTNGQMRELARAFCVAAMSADHPEMLPSDGWLNARLRDHGCPEDQFATYRARIRAMPLSGIADGHGQ